MNLQSTRSEMIGCIIPSDQEKTQKDRHSVRVQDEVENFIVVGKACCGKYCRLH